MLQNTFPKTRLGYHRVNTQFDYNDLYKFSTNTAFECTVCIFSFCSTRGSRGHSTSRRIPEMHTAAAAAQMPRNLQIG